MSGSDGTTEDPRVKAVEYLRGEVIGFNSTRTMFGGLLYELAVRAFKAEAAKDAVIAELREGLEWALDLLDMYDERLAKEDGAEVVYVPVHLRAIAKARAALALAADAAKEGR